MCGIAGYQGRFDATLLAAMGEAVAHRGPDGAGQHVNVSARSGMATGLAHRRLAIIDTSPAGAQPMTVHCNRCGAHSLDEIALTYNGELYNFPELREELAARGHTFSTRTDSEVLLHLYAEEGLRCVERLNGIFAFAIHDNRESGRPAGIERGDLFVARDHLGVKPLYWSTTPAGFLFASEIKAILRSAAVSRELDPVALHYFLAYLWSPAPHTLLRDVRKLEPGCALVARDGAIQRMWRYYEIPYGNELLDESEAQIAERVQEAVATAVRRQLISDVPVGCFLSGGLDSSAIVAMAKRAGVERPHCFTIDFEGDSSIEGAPNDLPFARKVAEHLGAELEVIRVNPTMIAELPRMLYHLDEPHADAAAINTLFIAERAREMNVPVLLSGTGGDDIFSGYRRHDALQMQRLVGRLPQVMRSGVARTARSLSVGGSRAMSNTLGRRVTKALAMIDASADEQLASYLWWSPDALRRGLYSNGLSEQLLSCETGGPMRSTLSRIDGVESDLLNRMLFLESKHFLTDHNLAYTDKMGMAVGVEIRVPLLDLDLVSLATRIPPALKHNGRTGKYIFKKAMEGVLPRDVIYRPKAGFGVPLRRWIREELSPVLDVALSAETLRARGLFDVAAVQKMLELERSGRLDASYTIFALLCLELWLQMFVDCSTPAVATGAWVQRSLGEIA